MGLVYSNHQGKTPWVASACADCPGFLVLAALLTRLPPWSLSLRLFPCASNFALRALGHLLGSAARSSPTTRAKTGRTAHVFTAQRGTRRNHPSKTSLKSSLPPSLQTSPLQEANFILQTSLCRKPMLQFFQQQDSSLALLKGLLGSM